MRLLFALVLVLVPVAASAGVSCFTITDTDQRALCRATNGGSRGDCVRSDFGNGISLSQELGSSLAGESFVTKSRGNFVTQNRGCRENRS
jgi:hypothetical protein